MNEHWHAGRSAVWFVTLQQYGIYGGRRLCRRHKSPMSGNNTFVATRYEQRALLFAYYHHRLIRGVTLLMPDVDARVGNVKAALSDYCRRRVTTITRHL